ncbi:transmembrane protein 150C isoform X2 [Sphaeramia orbicularis]|uniref:transmembrane protein 150C isoform X2 n=1 Tax=Sphaeramia orbicularis TaxID=375764 RepID=UPI001181403D|nr:transmembrane protein 150C isoform X2 [Sphaeramia orbicularis]
MDSVRGGRMRGISLWALLPPLYSLCVTIGLWVVYFVAVNTGQVVPLTSQYRRNGSARPPYISIAGNSPPASCIFSEVMNLAAFGGFVIALLRYLQLKNRIDKAWQNVTSLVVFSIGSFGMTLIGNFQLFIEEDIHNFGTFLTFGLGTVFCWGQSYLTFKVNLRNEGFKTSMLRFLLSGCITFCLVLYFSLMFQRLHMHAARSQWALVMFFLIFISSFCIELRYNHFEIVCTETNCRHEQKDSDTDLNMTHVQNIVD